MTKRLSFNDNKFTVTTHNGQIWLRGTEIAKALGMERTNAVTQIYNRNADEFTEAMTLNLKLRLKGFGGGNSKKDVRVFSLRGAHLVAMFARTPIAKEFRRWVLDILDKEVSAIPSKQKSPTQSEIDLQHLATLHRYLWDAHELLSKDIAPALRMLQSPLTGRLVGLVEAALVKEMMLHKQIVKRLPTQNKK